MVGLSKIPYKGVEQKRGDGNKDFKKWGQTGSTGGYLKKGGWTPLTNYGLILK